MAEKKYTCIWIGDIIVSIAGNVGKYSHGEIFKEGYTVDVLEATLPDKGMSDDEREEWIKESNERMEVVCKFLNENNL